MRKKARAGFVSAVGRLLAGHVGSSQAQRRGDILQSVRQIPAYRTATDRMIRGAIEDLREEGWLICNLMDDEGYFLASSLFEWEHFRALYTSYALTILARASKMDRTAEARWGAGALQQELLF